MYKNSQFHWSEANKYGLEFAKSKFYISTTITVALIIFGLQRDNLSTYFPAIMAFILAAFLSIAFFAIAWFSSMSFGNALVGKEDSIDEKQWDRGNRLAFLAWKIAAAGLTLLLTGFITLIITVFKSDIWKMVYN
jgi:hypothetical protein